MHLGIAVHFEHGTGSTGRINHRANRTILTRIFGQILISIISPFISIVNENALASTYFTGGTCSNIQLGTRQQSNALFQGTRTARVDVHGDIAVDGQIEIAGINFIKRQLCFDSLHSDLAVVCIQNQAVCSFIIVLNNITGLDVEHAIGADEFDRHTLNAACDSHGHVSLDGGLGFQLHGNFHVLDIVLGQGEYTLCVLDHSCTGSAAAPVHDLEILINSAAGIDGHITGTGNIAPDIQIRASLDRNVTAIIHVDEGNRSCGCTSVHAASKLLCG